MEFIYSSSTPNADTKRRLEGRAASGEDGYQHPVLGLTKQPRCLSHRPGEMHADEPVEELLLELHH